MNHSGGCLGFVTPDFGFSMWLGTRFNAILYTSKGIIVEIIGTAFYSDCDYLQHGILSVGQFELNGL